MAKNEGQYAGLGEGLIDLGKFLERAVEIGKSRGAHIVAIPTLAGIAVIIVSSWVSVH